MIDNSRNFSSWTPAPNNTPLILPAITIVQLNIRFAINLILSVFGTLFSACLLLVLVQRRHVKTGCVILMVHLMVVDVCLMGIVWPLGFLTTFISIHSSQTDTQCIVTLFLYGYFTTVEGWTQLMLAVNRFTATTFPHFYRRYNTRRTALLMVSITLCIALALHLPAVIGFEGKRWIPAARGCVYSRNHALLLAQGVFLYLPLGAALLLYTAVTLVWWKRHHSRHHTRIGPVSEVLESVPARAKHRRRSRVLCSLFAACAVHVTCLLPGVITSSSGWETSRPTITLVTRPLMLLGFVLTSTG